MNISRPLPPVHMHTSVLTRIYRPKGTNIISWPRPSSWMQWLSVPNICCMCQQSILTSVQCSLFRAQFMYFKLVLKICWWSQRAHYWFWGRPKGHIRGTVPFGKGLPNTDVGTGTVYRFSLLWECSCRAWAGGCQTSTAHLEWETNITICHMACTSSCTNCTYNTPV